MIKVLSVDDDSLIKKEIAALVNAECDRTHAITLALKRGIIEL